MDDCEHFGGETTFYNRLKLGLGLIISDVPECNAEPADSYYLVGKVFCAVVLGFAGSTAIARPAVL